LFAALGRRAPQATTPAVAVFLSGASLAHGFRAGLIEPRLPVSIGLPGVVESTSSPDPALGEAILRIVEADDAGVLDGLLGSLYPAMTIAYAHHLASASPAADPPISRMLQRILSDLEAIRREGSDIAGPFGRLIGRSGVARGVDDWLMRSEGVFGPPRRNSA
jgi:hypothetical protein